MWSELDDLVKLLISLSWLKFFKYLIKLIKLYLFCFSFWKIGGYLLLVCIFIVCNGWNGFFKMVWVGGRICLVVFLFVVKVFVCCLRLMIMKRFYVKKEVD